MIFNSGVSEKDRIELYTITVVNSDISAALFMTRLFMKQIKTMRDEGYLELQDSIVISYGRPFRGNRPYGALDSKWEQFPTAEFRELHKILLNSRDKIVAHSDLKHRKVQIIPPNSSKVPGVGKNATLAIQLSTVKITLGTFPRIEQLRLFLGGKLNQEMFKLLDQTYGKINLPTTPFDLI